MRIGKYEASDGGNSAGTAVTFLLIGLGAGALLGLLLAPKPGKQLRKDLRKKYDSARETVEDWTDDAKSIESSFKLFRKKGQPHLFDAILQRRFLHCEGGQSGAVLQTWWRPRTLTFGVALAEARRPTLEGRFNTAGRSLLR